MYRTKYREAQTLASDDSRKRQTEEQVMSVRQRTNQRTELGAVSQSEERGGHPAPRLGDKSL